MIYAFTGQPGAGKTLNAIKFVLEDKMVFFEDGVTRRPVYYFGIKGLNIDSWSELSEEEVYNWFDLPDYSIIVIDECQDIWRPRSAGKPVPKHVELLEKHRHRGFDFVLTFQFPKQVDTIVRELITDHFHFHRALGLNSSTRYRWDYLCQNTSSKAEQKKAEESIVAFDKSIFDFYHSASLHTAKRRIPWKVWLIFPLFIFVILISIFGIGKFRQLTGQSADDEPVPNDSSLLDSVDNVVRSGSNYSIPVVDNVSSYLKLFSPRIENVPDSAPIFDEVKSVTDYPRYSCIQRLKETPETISCVCYTQQATRAKIDEKTCKFYVANGFPFDPYRPSGRSRETGIDSASSANRRRTASN